MPDRQNLTYRAKLLDPKPIPEDIIDKKLGEGKGKVMVGGGITRHPAAASSQSRWRSARYVNDRSVSQWNDRVVAM